MYIPAPFVKGEEGEGRGGESLELALLRTNLLDRLNYIIGTGD